MHEPGVPDDELELAEELADLASDLAFAGTSPKELDDLFDAVAEMYATEFDEE